MKFQLIKIGQLGIGKIFGEVDAVNNRNYSNTIKWLSSQGTLLRFKSEDFFKILKEVHLQSFTDIENEAKKADYNLPLYLDRNKVVEESSKKINMIMENDPFIWNVEYVLIVLLIEIYFYYIWISLIICSSHLL